MRISQLLRVLMVIGVLLVVGTNALAKPTLLQGWQPTGEDAFLEVFMTQDGSRLYRIPDQPFPQMFGNIVLLMANSDEYVNFTARNLATGEEQLLRNIELNQAVFQPTWDAAGVSWWDSPIEMCAATEDFSRTECTVMRLVAGRGCTPLVEGGSGCPFDFPDFGQLYVYHPDSRPGELAPFMHPSLLYSLGLSFEGLPYQPENFWAFVYTMVAQQQLILQDHPGEFGEVLGVVVPGMYYNWLDVEGGWTQIRTANGTEGWVQNFILSVDLENTAQMYADAAIADESTTVTVYPTLQDYPLAPVILEFLEEENVQTSVNLANVAVFVWEEHDTIQQLRLPAKSSLACLAVDIASITNLPNELEAETEMLCMVVGIAAGPAGIAFAGATILANPDRYIDSWYMPLHNYIERNVSVACMFSWAANINASQCDGWKPRAP